MSIILAARKANGNIRLLANGTAHVYHSDAWVVPFAVAMEGNLEQAEDLFRYFRRIGPLTDSILREKARTDLSHFSEFVYVSANQIFYKFGHRCLALRPDDFTTHIALGKLVPGIFVPKDDPVTSWEHVGKFAVSAPVPVPDTERLPEGSSFNIYDLMACAEWGTTYAHEHLYQEIEIQRATENKTARIKCHFPAQTLPKVLESNPAAVECLSRRIALR